MTVERFQIVDTSNFGQKWILRSTFRMLINPSVFTLEKLWLPGLLLHMFSEKIYLNEILVKCLEHCQIANICKIRKSSHVIEILNYSGLRRDGGLKLGQSLSLIRTVIWQYKDFKLSTRQILVKNGFYAKLFVCS